MFDGIAEAKERPGKRGAGELGQRNFLGGWFAVKCPFCRADSDKVVDSRSSDAGRVIRRRRQCLVCKRRFTTYEKVGESFKLYVIKKDNSRVPYDREKVMAGLQKACYKRPVSAEEIQQIVERVEEDIFKNFDKEVSSAFIGESVMKHLSSADKVAYIRFASVYRDFKDAGELIDEVSETIRRSESATGGQE
jgi:transcriptional repressor NrdR